MILYSSAGVGQAQDMHLIVQPARGTWLIAIEAHCPSIPLKEHHLGSS